MIRRLGHVLLCGLLLLAAGCGGASTPASSGSSGTKPAAGSSGAASAKKLISFNFGYPAASGSFTEIYVGKAKGFFAKNGLDVHLQLLRGSSTEGQALLSGGVDMVVIDANSALAAIAKGAKFVLVGNDLDSFPFQLWAKPSITSVAQLKGKVLGLEHVGALSDTAAHELLPKFGLSFKDVKPEYLGSPANTTAGLLAGRVPAAISDPPASLKAASHGFHLLYDLMKLPHVSGGFLVRKSFLSAHAAEVTDFLKGYVEATAWMKNPANEPAVLKIMSQYTHITNHALLAGTYKFFAPHLQCDPQVTPAQIGDAVTWVKQHDQTTIDPAKVIDTQALQALRSSGFVAKYCKAAK